jgi:hypothetical protein
MHDISVVELIDIEVDWSAKRIDALFGDEPIIGTFQHKNEKFKPLIIRQPRIYSTLFHLLDDLKLKGIKARINLERNFESYDKSKYDLFKQRCKEEGHEIRIVNPKSTGSKRRKVYGIVYDEKKKSKKNMPEILKDHNRVDVNVIRAMRLSGVFFGPIPKKPWPQWMLDNVKIINKELVWLRASGKREEFNNTFIELLPHPHCVPDYIRKSLCIQTSKSKKAEKWEWNPNILATIATILIVDNRRNSRDKYTGHYGLNKESMAASEIKHHGWPNAQKNKATKQNYRQAIRHWLPEKINELFANGKEKILFSLSQRTVEKTKATPTLVFNGG